MSLEVVRLPPTPDQLVYAFLQPAPAVEQVFGEAAHVAERLAGFVERRREDEGVGGIANASLLARLELARPQLGECLYNAPVGLCAFVSHDTWSPVRSLRHFRNEPVGQIWS